MLARQRTASQRNEPHFKHARLHSFDPALSLQVPARRRRVDATLLCRLWLGVAFTNAYALRIVMADTVACERCGNKETIGHIFCECPQYSAQRLSICNAPNKLDERPLSKERTLRRRRDTTSQKKELQALLASCDRLAFLNDCNQSALSVCVVFYPACVYARFFFSLSLYIPFLALISPPRAG